MNLKDAPIQRKLMSVILLTCAIVVLLMSTAYIIFQYNIFRKNLISQVSTIARITASNNSGTLAFERPDEATENLQSLATEPRIVAACLYDDSGKLFAKYPAKLNDSVLPVFRQTEGFSFANGYLEGYVPVMQEGKREGTFFIRSAMTDMFVQLRRYMILAVILMGCSLFVAYLLSKLLRKRIAQPIIELEKTARVISEKNDYSVRGVKKGNDEVGALTDAFNEMLTRIETQNSEIRSFNQKLEQKVRERTNELQSANNYLQQQNDFVETIIDASAHIIAVLDRELRFTTINRIGEEIYRMTKAEMLGKKYLDIFPQAADSDAHKDMLRALQGEHVHNTVARSAIIKGYFENYFIPLKQGSEVYGVLILSHDITAIMEANEKLKDLNQELEKSNRDLEQFAFIASHDLQEPLRKIHIFNDLLGENYHDEATMRKYQAKIDQSAKRMQDLILDVLNFSRISKSEEGFVPVDLNEILRSLEGDFELLIQEKQARIIADHLPVIPGIELQLSQLFSNLISNSLKYNDKLPEIRITARHMTVAEVSRNSSLHPGADYVEILFTDNGIGFEARYSEQIFTIFQRLHGKQSYSGTGIGLALCRKIVENHHGLITANSSLGNGATFTIILPLSVVNESETALAAK